MVSLTITAHKLSEDIVAIPLRGYLNSQHLWDIEAVFKEFYQKGVRKFIVNLLELEHISSSIVWFLIRFLERVREEKGDMVLVQPNDEVRKRLDIFGLAEIVKIVTDQAKARTLLD